MQISTLRKIVKALGGELEVFGKIAKGLVKIDQFETHRPKPWNHGPEEMPLA